MECVKWGIVKQSFISSCQSLIWANSYFPKEVKQKCGSIQRRHLELSSALWFLAPFSFPPHHFLVERLFSILDEECKSPAPTSDLELKSRIFLIIIQSPESERDPPHREDCVERSVLPEGKVLKMLASVMFSPLQACFGFIQFTQKFWIHPVHTKNFRKTKCQ